MVSMASEAKFDIREDEEQYERLQDCVDLLVAAGYFRARVKGINAFDKIVGGIVWCISTCNYSVDVDLLYAENSTIGQKIALTEKIVEVLPRLECPFRIEPHQIQGLDFIHIFPVVQWLVKKAIEAKELHGDQNQSFTDYLYSGGHKKTTTEQEPSSSSSDTNLFVSLKSSISHPRVYKRSQGMVIGSLKDDLVCTLAEYAHNPDATISEQQRNETTGSSEQSPSVDGLTVSSVRTKASGKAMRKLINEEDIERLSKIRQASEPKDIPTQIAEVEDEMTNLLQEEAVLKSEMEEEEKRHVTLQEEAEQLEAELNRLESLESTMEQSELDELRHLFDEYMLISTRETAFKASCRKEIDELEEEIEGFKRDREQNESTNSLSCEAELMCSENELMQVRLLSAEISRRISLLQRSLDSVPSQIELAQYHKRFIELYNQIGTKHRHTRQCYVLHNSLIDIRNYMKKEIELLNSIEEVLPMAKLEENRDSFLQQLTNIQRGVEANLEKLLSKERELEFRKDCLSDEIVYLKDKERTFHRTVDEFKKECERNELLRTQLRAQGYSDE